MVKDWLNQMLNYTAGCVLISSLLITSLTFAQPKKFFQELSGLSDYISSGEIFTQKEAKEFLNRNRDEIKYKSNSLTTYPIIPFQLFGIEYIEDIVIETTHPSWSMHEFARINMNEREIWIAKDSDLNGVQYITSDLDQIESWAPEIPLPRYRKPLIVKESSTPERLIVDIEYLNPASERVVVHFESKRPLKSQKLRNGSTFNHSGDFVSALLDISAKEINDTIASVKYDGVKYPVRKVLGLIPVKALLHQTQGGFAIASFTQIHGLIVRPAPFVKWNTHSIENWNISEDFTLLSYNNGFTEWKYSFCKGELIEAEVRNPKSEFPITKIRLSSPLPDLSRIFGGEVIRNFIIEINGLIQGKGHMIAKSTSNGAELKIIPTAPRWFAKRPIKVTININNNIATLLALREYR